MEDIERYKAYSAMADVSRKWVAIMDAKAAFLSALNAGTIAFIWTGLKFHDAQGCPRVIAIIATILLLASIGFALYVILPRTTLRQAFGRPTAYVDEHKPFSFFGYIANNYTTDKYAEYQSLVNKMDARGMASEQLEQHFTISHVVATKSISVTRSGWLWFLASILIVVAIVLKA
jgi:hypothetical protein